MNNRQLFRALAIVSTAFNVVTGIMIFVNSNPLARCAAAIFGLSVESPEAVTPL